jgi:hypothetical protein
MGIKWRIERLNCNGNCVGVGMATLRCSAAGVRKVGESGGTFTDSARLPALVFAFADFGQAPPEIKAKLDAKILQPGNREQPANLNRSMDQIATGKRVCGGDPATRPGLPGSIRVGPNPAKLGFQLPIAGGT